MVCTEDLMSAGLLTEEEADELSKCSNKKNQVTLWISTWVHMAIQKGFMEPIYAQNLMSAIRGVRSSSSTLRKEVARRVPISFAQLIQLVIDGANLLTPPALAYAFRSNNDSMSVYTWPAMGSMIIAFFYQGGVRIVEALEEPFGSDVDDLNPDWCLATSDLKIFNFLTAGGAVLPDFLHNRMEPPVNEVTGEEFPLCSIDNLPSVTITDEDWIPTPTTAVTIGRGRRGVPPSRFHPAVKKQDSLAERNANESVSPSSDVRIEMSEGQYSDEDDQHQDQYSEIDSGSAFADGMPLGSESSWDARGKDGDRTMALPQVPGDHSHQDRLRSAPRIQGPVLAVDFQNEAIRQIEDILERRFSTAKVRATAPPPLASKPAVPTVQQDAKLIEEVDSPDKMMMDLLARFHSELRSNAELRATMAAMEKAQVGEVPEPWQPAEEVTRPSPPGVTITAAHKAAAAQVFKPTHRPDYTAKPRQRALPPSRPQARQALMGRGTPSQALPAPLGSTPPSAAKAYPALGNGPPGKYKPQYLL